MKLRTFAIAALLIGFVSNYTSAQTSVPTIIDSSHLINDCTVYVDTWFIDEVGAAATTDDSMSSQVSVGVMNDTWLYEIGLVVSFHFDEDFTGTVTFRHEIYAEKSYNPNEFYHRVRDYAFTGVWTADQEKTIQLGAYFESTGIWDGIPGDYREALLDVEVLESIPGFIRVDIVKVKRHYSTSVCGLH